MQRFHTLRFRIRSSASTGRSRRPSQSEHRLRRGTALRLLMWRAPPAWGEGWVREFGLELGPLTWRRGKFGVRSADVVTWQVWGWVRRGGDVA
eukprot:5305330-Prymnesium_polylepis.1